MNQQQAWDALAPASSLCLQSSMPSPAPSGSGRKTIQNLNFPSSKFVLSAGSVLFRTHPTTHNLQICVIYNARNQHWILPKGRKDQNESMDVTAVRETFEETGFPCQLYPCTLNTRAPPPGGSLKPYVVLEVQDSVEPFYMTVRQLKDGSLKTIWWYITWLKGNNAEKVLGVQMPSEDGYVSNFVDIEEAMEVFKGSNFEEIIVKAVKIVQGDELEQDASPPSVD